LLANLVNNRLDISPQRLSKPLGRPASRLSA
jgi:hypothetical protein